MALPPEEGGGLWGYADSHGTIAGPKDENRRDMETWTGDKFDRETYLAEAVNEGSKKDRRPTPWESHWPVAFTFLMANPG